MIEKSRQKFSEEGIFWRQLYKQTSEILAEINIERPEIEARWIIEKASGYEGSAFVTGLDERATVLGVKQLDAIIEKRRAGEPLQYALGSWGFRNLDLYLDKRVLIPRPETEILVDIAHELLTNDEETTVKHIVDLGTGSGAIGLSIAQERADVEVLLIDSSQEALKVTAANVAGLGNHAKKIQILHGSWFAAIPEEYKKSFSLVVSNPPYISLHEELPSDVIDWEPHSALFAGEKGTEDIELIINQARHWLHPNGALAIEMAPHQTKPNALLASEIGYRDIKIHKDLAGKPRVMSCRWKS